MRALCFLILASVLPTSQPAQQSANTNGPADLTVVNFSWRKERLPGWENRTVNSNVENYEAMRDRLDNERKIQQARNAGNKAEVGRRESAAKMLDDAKGTQDAKKSEPPRDGYRYKVGLENKGSKTVSSIDWDYFFLDPNTQEVLARHQFTSDEKIKPGKSKELSVFYLTPPVKTVSAEMLSRKEPQAFTEIVVIMRVQYSDGSIWQRP